MNEATPDLILKMAIQSALGVQDDTDGRADCPIILTIKGLIVTGTLISYEEWARAHILTDKIQESLSAALKKEEQPISSLDIAPENVENVAFLHLRDARFYSSSNVPLPNTGIGLFYRCHLSAVDGFAISAITHL